MPQDASGKLKLTQYVESIAVTKGLNIVGTVLLISGLIFWVLSAAIGMHYYTQAELLLPTSIAIIHLPFILEPESSSRVYLAHSNLLSTIGMVSLPFHVNSSLFLVAGLTMAFFAYFLKGVREARNTEFIWSNVLIALGSYFVFTGELALGTPIQITGLALTTLTLNKTKRINWSTVGFDNMSYKLLSIWAWGLSFSILYWLVIGRYYSGFSFLIQGIMLIVAVGKLYGGLWPLRSKKKTIEMS